MSNEITLNSATTFTRVSKSGKVTQRTALGVMTSGNRAESMALGRIAARALIEANTFAPVMREMVRVFAPSTLKKFGISAIGDGFAHYDCATKTITAIDGRWGAAASELYCRAILARCEALETEGKEIKGEKAAYWEIADMMVTHCDDKAEAKRAVTKLAEAKLAEAKLAASSAA